MIRKYLCFVVLVLIIMSTNMCLADNSVRIEELKKEQQKIAHEIQSGQQYIQNKQIELMKTQGAIEELQAQDKTQQPAPAK